MVPGATWALRTEFSPQEQLHAQFAFTQPRGATYGEIQLQEFAGPLGSRRYHRGEGGIVFD